jgi:transposase
VKKKTYTKEFKLGAVKLVLEQGVTVARAARDLGVCHTTVGKWVANYQQHGNGAFPGKEYLPPADEELRRLQKENRRLTMERDILKKAIAFFAEHDRKNMAS